MGKLIAIDGLDASGKTTQAELLYNRLEIEGRIKAKLVAFPDYDDPSSSLVRMYLSGEFGSDPSCVNAYAASVFYAVDRYASFKRKWEDFWQKENTVIILARYTTSNAIHQLSKIQEDGGRTAFLDWLIDFEHRKMGIPEPDLVLYLDMPPEIALQLIDERASENANTIKDIHERSRSHLFDSYSAAMFAAQRLGWTRLSCYDFIKNQLYTREYMHNMIYEMVMGLLGKE